MIHYFKLTKTTIASSGASSTEVTEIFSEDLHNLTLRAEALCKEIQGQWEDGLPHQTESRMVTGIAHCVKTDEYYMVEMGHIILS